MKCTNLPKLLILLAIFASASMAQSVQCPDGMVCISRAAAEKAVETAAERDALKKENAALKIAINGNDDPANPIKGYKEIIAEWREKYAAIAGEYSGYKQGRVSVDAAFQTAVANTRKKCLPLSLCF